MNGPCWNTSLVAISAPARTFRGKNLLTFDRCNMSLKYIRSVRVVAKLKKECHSGCLNHFFCYSWICWNFKTELNQVDEWELKQGPDKLELFGAIFNPSGVTYIPSLTSAAAAATSTTMSATSAPTAAAEARVVKWNWILKLRRISSEFPRSTPPPPFLLRMYDPMLHSFHDFLSAWSCRNQLGADFLFFDDCSFGYSGHQFESQPWNYPKSSLLLRKIDGVHWLYQIYFTSSIACSDILPVELVVLSTLVCVR